MVTILISICHYTIENTDTSPSPTSPTPLTPPPYIEKINKWYYNYNETLKRRPILTQKEVQVEIGSEVGEVTDFLIENDIVTIPENSQQCGRGDCPIWKDHKMHVVQFKDTIYLHVKNIFKGIFFDKTRLKPREILKIGYI